MVLSTTGHSEKYLENNPGLSIKIRSSTINLEALLSPFPAHIRKTKNLAQSGNAQVGLGTLCHKKLVRGSEPAKAVLATRTPFYEKRFGRKAFGGIIDVRFGQRPLPRIE